MAISNFVSVPPDSSGKKIRHYRIADIFLTITDEINFLTLKRGDRIDGDESGAESIFSSYTPIENGVILHAIPLSDINYKQNEVVSYNDLAWGIVQSYNDIYQTSFTMADVDNPLNTQKIDSNGTSFVRFKDGDLLLDSFGNVQTSGTTILKSYVFPYDGNPYDFIDYTNEGGATVPDPQNSIIRLTTNSNNESSVHRISSLYFPHTPLQSNITTMTISSGDAGKDGVVRRWGMFDMEDGIFFELDGDVFSVNIKSSITNTTTKVVQQDFNSNRLIDSVIDGFRIDLSKFNLYWLDYQWQGIVRFGIYSPDGARVIIHKFENANSLILPYMKRGSLPFSIQQFNKSIVASSSELKCSSVSVARQSDDVFYVGNIREYTSGLFLNITNTAVPLVSIKPRLVVNGVKNRVVIVPVAFEFFVEGNPILVKFLLNPGLVGDNFIDSTEFSQVDSSATSFVDQGFKIDSSIYPIGYTDVSIAEDITRSLAISPDGNFANYITLSSECIKPESTASVYCLIRWKEVI